MKHTSLFIANSNNSLYSVYDEQLNRKSWFFACRHQVINKNLKKWWWK